MSPPVRIGPTGADGGPAPTSSALVSPPGTPPGPSPGTQSREQGRGTTESGGPSRASSTSGLVGTRGVSVTKAMAEGGAGLGGRGALAGGVGGPLPPSGGKRTNGGIGPEGASTGGNASLVMMDTRTRSVSAAACSTSDAGKARPARRAVAPSRDTTRSENSRCISAQCEGQGRRGGSGRATASAIAMS